MALSAKGNGLSRLTALFRDNPRDLVLVLGMLGILVALFSPIPPWLLDFLLLTNLSFSLTILLLTFYSDKPIQFSTFPSLLLITTLFRLSLNISATRLILSDASAGQVIDSVGTYVVGGNYAIGLVVFFILIVVQYVVVTNGAQRVAEVAARFTLDSMPGKQMSIDADLNMGLLTEKEAQKRRGDIEREANFYGAMDGATKFVKGDAIAGIIIILIDIIAGLTVGIVQLGMSWDQSLQTFTLLTVGDGIVTQIPSLVVAVATGILIKRAATDARLGDELSRQLASNPKVLLLVAGTVGLFGFAPGIPALPVLLIAGALGLLAWMSLRRSESEMPTDEGAESAPAPDAVASADFEQLLEIRPISIAAGSDVAAYFQREGPLFADQIGNLRKDMAVRLGFVCPEIQISDASMLRPEQYQVLFNGFVVDDGTLFADRTLAISPGGKRPPLEGIAAKEPAYKLDAVWIEAVHRDSAKQSGYTVVQPDTLLITHLQELLNRHAHLLLTRAMVESMVQRVSDKLGGMVDELIPSVLSYSDLQRVLQGLLSEGVSVRNLPTILECLVDVGRTTKDIGELTEKVREQLGRQIVQSLLSGDDEIKVITLDADLESRLLRNIKPGDNGPVLVPEPAQIDALIQKVSTIYEQQLGGGVEPVVVCSAKLRAPFQRFCERVVPAMKVISVGEVAPGTPLSTVAVIR
ncbi:MAG: flagellar biosynthesis protein FlhA [Pseudomonadota bacterium]